MKKLLISIWLLLVVWPACGASTSESITATSGTVTLTKTFSSSPLFTLSYAWTSDAAGAVVATLPNVEGSILRVVTNPGDGLTSPTDNYDVTLSDEDGIDVLNGLGADRDQSNSEMFTCRAKDNATTLTTIAIAVNGNLSLAIAAAGNTQSGVLKLYLRRE